MRMLWLPALICLGALASHAAEPPAKSDGQNGSSDLSKGKMVCPWF